MPTINIMLTVAYLNIWESEKFPLIITKLMTTHLNDRLLLPIAVTQQRPLEQIYKHITPMLGASLLIYYKYVPHHQAFWTVLHDH